MLVCFAFEQNFVMNILLNKNCPFRNVCNGEEIKGETSV